MKDGKLFGKINIIDLLVVLVIIAVGAAVGMKLLSPGNSTDDGPMMSGDIVYTTLVEGVSKNVAENAASFVEEAKKNGLPGDQLLAGAQMIEGGYVTDVEMIPRKSDYVITGGDGSEYLLGSANEKVDMVFTIQAHVQDVKTSKVGTQEVRVGKTHIVKTQHVELYNGVVLSCEWSNEAAAQTGM